MLALVRRARKAALLLEPVGLDELVSAAAARWTGFADRHWRTVADAGVLRADRRRLDAMLDALVENAVAATDDGDPISIVAIAEGRTAVLSVSDAGEGIPAESLAHVFAHRGAGRGLAIVKASAAAHRGKVTVASTVGHGTTVTVRLPGLRAA
jgi:two-component system phosphate regulon sensor histidine kinase PhoR